ncbi:putative oxidoreductase GLYR1 [Trichonephila inaurata madagascariensis]|uniref:Putative oxidoreductase GLYR1 n=1 Tax=Trichonephila inaurata madagascariensis TaxID=2747483 RepID=A0A8X6YKG3_9ARAC|nr:putative oxidoreductase GLYR1 [Trichonephila inaurata madagascariensis]
MATVGNFKPGDLVWAKLKKVSYWPGKIIDPPTEKEETDKGGQKEKLSAEHYVSFFGEEGNAWILEENIVPHSEEMLLCGMRKKSTAFMKAVAEMIVESGSLIPELKPLKEKSAKSDEPSCSAAQKTETIPKTPSVQEDELLKKSGNHEDSSEPCEDSLVPSHDDSEDPIEPTSKKIGFMGLGAMGKGIVKNLLKTGHNVSVWNRTPDKCRRFVAAGAQQFLTPSDVIKNCDITFCCVSGVEAVLSIVFENGGILKEFQNSERGSKGFVVMTSMSVEASEQVAEAIFYSGGRYLEAPLVGSKCHAKLGTLLVHGAGDEQLFRDCSSVFFATSSLVFYVSCEVGVATRMNILFRMLWDASYDVLADADTLLARFRLLSQVN